MSLYHTGHSLGAVIADLCQLWLYCDSHDPMLKQTLPSSSITFENPGSMASIQDAIASNKLSKQVDDLIKRDITNYDFYLHALVFNADINAINSIPVSHILDTYINPALLIIFMKTVQAMFPLYGISYRILPFMISTKCKRC